MDVPLTLRLFVHVSQRQLPAQRSAVLPGAFPRVLAHTSGRLACMMRVLTLKGHQDPKQMGAYFVAALLNAASRRTDPLPPYQVRDIWQEFIATGAFSPPPGVDRWDAELIKGYLETTWA